MNKKKEPSYPCDIKNVSLKCAMCSIPAYQISTKIFISSFFPFLSVFRCRNATVVVSIEIVECLCAVKEFLEHFPKDCSQWLLKGFPMPLDHKCTMQSSSTNAKGFQKIGLWRKKFFARKAWISQSFSQICAMQAHIYYVLYSSVLPRFHKLSYRTL